MQTNKEKAKNYWKERNLKKYNSNGLIISDYSGRLMEREKAAKLTKIDCNNPINN